MISYFFFSCVVDESFFQVPLFPENNIAFATVRKDDRCTANLYQ